ncbi:ATP synthase subunit I [Desulfobacter postgatei]|uniref:ATP synthase I chain n=1 Tax=Desulfobacter postgatei 2ac9 TaxID=879212 RepID=I5B2W6_9BACT|nr:ATP synthase subunit I [Desulfobacter postgatei]EIM63829.1 ATP synthase I chain [Desulfobacter postgatei 2ac9]
MDELEKIVNFITRTNWLLFLGSSLVALLIFSPKVYIGVFLGGLIVTINFHVLKNTVTKNFNQKRVLEKGKSLIGALLVKYYLRFALTAVIIFLLIAKRSVHPVGLLAGLSVVVASTFIAAAIELTKIIFREAV